MRNLHLTTAATRSKSDFVPVSLHGSPVMNERQQILKPYSIFFTDGENVHASQPWLSVEQTADIYTLIFMLLVSQ